METQKSLREMAETYEPKSKTKNIADLDKVPVDCIIETETFKNKQNEEVTIKYITVDGQKYRVPDSVLINLKAILSKRPEIKHFCVSRTGTGKDDTRYTVIPLGV